MDLTDSVHSERSHEISYYRHGRKRSRTPMTLMETINATLSSPPCSEHAGKAAVVSWADNDYIQTRASTIDEHPPVPPTPQYSCLPPPPPPRPLPPPPPPPPLDVYAASLSDRQKEVIKYQLIGQVLTSPTPFARAFSGAKRLGRCEVAVVAPECLVVDMDVDPPVDGGNLNSVSWMRGNFAESERSGEYSSSLGAFARRAPRRSGLLPVPDCPVDWTRLISVESSRGEWCIQ